MTYTIDDGIPEAELDNWLRNALEKYGKYENGGVDFTNDDKAPIVMCTVRCGDEILIVKRAYGLADAEGYWSTINGFIDTIGKSVRDVAQQELKEELDLDVEVDAIKVRKSYTLRNPKEIRAYIVFPCLIELDARPDIKLDREHTEYTWIKRPELENYHILDDLLCAVDKALGLTK